MKSKHFSFIWKMNKKIREAENFTASRIFHVKTTSIQTPHTHSDPVRRFGHLLCSTH